MQWQGGSSVSNVATVHKQAQQRVSHERLPAPVQTGEDATYQPRLQ